MVLFVRTMSAIEIRQHTPGENVSDFVKAAHVVFEDDPNWIPPLNIMLKDQLSPKSPFFQHAEVTLFTAHKNGKIVGRASAQVDHEHLKRYRDDTGFFGFFDTINDEEVARALMQRAKDWLKGKGMKHIRGPMSLGINQEVGALVEGFDTPPMVMMPHSRSYQGALIESTGLQKVKDLYAWRWEVGPEMPRRCMAAHREMLDMGFKFRPTDLWKEMDQLVAIFDNAWQHNWGYVPMTRAEADQLRNELRLILDPEIA